MKMWKYKTWQHEVTGSEIGTTLFGVNIFDYEWKYTGKKVIVKDPLYGQEYNAMICKVVIDGKEYEFAYDEFSNGIYGFYVYKY